LRAESAYLKLLGTTRADGPTLHNWLVNRAGYVVGEQFDAFAAETLRMSSLPFTYPATPIPPELSTNPFMAKMDKALAGLLSEEEAGPKAETSMSNVGTALYLVGKKVNVPLALKFSDRFELPIRSPRVGLFQVGPGFFTNQYGALENQASAIGRIEVLFHESRHSDGNGETAGYFHATCPDGHDYAGLPACDVSSNGPYTIGGYTERHLIANCRTCTVRERILHQAGIADNFSRVLDNGPMQLLGIQENLRFHEQLLALYTARVATITGEAEMAEMANELAALRERVEVLRSRAAIALLELNSPARVVDPTPEGDVRTITLEQSQVLMNVSLNPNVP
jgi:hypothetical protein